jgi:hypothetical protein
MEGSKFSNFFWKLLRSENFVDRIEPKCQKWFNIRVKVKFLLEDYILIIKFWLWVPHFSCRCYRDFYGFGARSSVVKTTLCRRNNFKYFNNCWAILMIITKIICQTIITVETVLEYLASLTSRPVLTAILKLVLTSLVFQTLDPGTYQLNYWMVTIFRRRISKKLPYKLIKDNFAVGTLTNPSLMKTQIEIK